MEDIQIIEVKGLKFGVAHTSLLKRAICILRYVLEEADQMWIPVNKVMEMN